MTWKLYPISVFDQHQAAWQHLNQAQCASPLLDVDFIIPAIKEFGSGNEVLAVFAEGTPRAMAILRPVSKAGWETFQPSQAPIGAWVFDRNLDLQLLLTSLLKKLPGFTLMVGVSQQDPAMASRPTDRSTIRTIDYIETARVSVDRSFDDYWQARGKNLRHNMKKQRNNLEKMGVVTRLEEISSPEKVAAAISDYGRIESSSWKAQGGTAINIDNAQGRFYKAMLENFCRRGAGKIYRYWYGDKIAAMDLCIEGKEEIIILKTTYDEAVSQGTSPAFLMRQELFNQIFAEGRLKRIEFYGKLMDWHTKWSEETRRMYHVNCYRWPLLAAIKTRLTHSSEQKR